MGISRHATAHWEGDLKSGQGRLSTPQSGLLDNTRYGFNSRFGEEKGTNPEELIAAAHAGCFSMALSAQLGNAGITAESINTVCTITLDKVEGGFGITESHLDVKVKIPGGDKSKFDQAAAEAKAGCPLSKVLNAKVTMDAALEA